MGRPRKLTLDFFLHDADARHDRKLKNLRRKHGNDGYACYFILLEILCKENGMTLDMSDTDDVEWVVDETGLRDIPHLYAIIQAAADYKLFDKQLWESERVVFSHGLFNRYKSRLETRKADAERQRRKREAESLKKRIEDLEEKEESNTKTDPDTEGHNGRLRDNPHVTPDNTVVTSDNTLAVKAKPFDKQAFAFEKKRWREGSSIKASLIDHIHKTEEWCKTRAQARAHVLNLESELIKTGDLNHRAKLEGYCDDLETIATAKEARPKYIMGASPFDGLIEEQRDGAA